MKLLELIKDSVEGLSDKVKTLYEKKEDGKYHLCEELREDAKRANNFSDLKKNQETLTTAFENLQNKFKEQESIKQDLTEIKNKFSLESKEKENKSKNKNKEEVKNDGVSDEVRRMLSKSKEEQDKLLKQNQELIRLIESQKIDSELSSAINSNGGNEKLLTPLLKNRIKLVKNNETNKSEIRVLNDNNEFILNDDGVGYKSIESFVSDIKKEKDFSPLFKKEAKAGAGINASNNHTTLNQVTVSSVLSSMNQQQKNEYIKKFGIDKFKELVVQSSRQKSEERKKQNINI